jgi:hypothetical protein
MLGVLTDGGEYNCCLDGAVDPVLAHEHEVGRLSLRYTLPAHQPTTV